MLEITTFDGSHHEVSEATRVAEEAANAFLADTPESDIYSVQAQTVVVVRNNMLTYVHIITVVFRDRSENSG